MLGYSQTATAGHCRHRTGNLCLQRTKVAGLRAPGEMRPGTWDPASQGCAFSREASLHGACPPGAAACSQPFAGASRTFLIPALQLALLRCQRVAEGISAESHSAPQRGVVQGNALRKDTAPFLCLRFAVSGILSGPSDGGVSRP